MVIRLFKGAVKFSVSASMLQLLAVDRYRLHEYRVSMYP